MPEPLDGVQLAIMADVLEMIDPATDEDTAIDITIRLARTEPELTITVLSNLLAGLVKQLPPALQKAVLENLAKAAANYGTPA